MAAAADGESASGAGDSASPSAGLAPPGTVQTGLGAALPGAPPGTVPLGGTAPEMTPGMAMGTMPTTNAAAHAQIAMLEQLKQQQQQQLEQQLQQMQMQMQQHQMQMQSRARRKSAAAGGR